MLKTDILYESSVGRVLLYTASYEGESVEMANYNEFACISFPIRSAFNYKAGGFDGILDTNTILLEAPDTEFKIRKFPIYRQDITVSIQLKMSGFHLIEEMQKQQKKVGSIRRTPDINCFLQSFLRSLHLKTDQRDFAFGELLEELLVPASPFFDLKRLNHEQGMKIEWAKEYLHDRFSEPINLEDIAKASFTSPFHFSRVFKEKTGISPYQYLLQIRITRARQLLKRGYPVVSCAYQVGFNSLSNFSYCFKKIVGCSPTEYKKSNISKIR